MTLILNELSEPANAASDQKDTDTDQANKDDYNN